MPFDFPSDLIEASLTCKNLRGKLDALAVDDLPLADGTPTARKRSAANGFAVAGADEVAKWRAERLAAAELVVTHPFWENVPPEDRMKARSALKHHGETD